MKQTLAALLGGLLTSAAAFGLEVEFAWRWPGVVNGDRYHELVVRAAPRLPEYQGELAARLVLDGDSSAVSRLDARVSVRQHRSGLRSGPELARYAVALPLANGTGMTTQSIFVPSSSSLLELSVATPDGRTASKRVLADFTEEYSRHDRSEYSRTLLVLPERMRNRYSRLGDTSRATSSAGELPANPAAYWPFNRIELEPPVLDELSPSAFDALHAWLLQGGELRLRGEPPTTGQRLARLVGPAGRFEETLRTTDSSSERRVLATRAGLGRIVAGDLLPRPLPTTISAGSCLDLSPATDRLGWYPKGSLMRERLAGYVGWLLPYALAVAGALLLLARRKADQFLRVMPALCASFAIFYGLVYATQTSELVITRTRLEVGQAGQPAVARARFVSVFCASRAAAEVRFEGAEPLPPFELARHQARYGRNEPTDVLVLGGDAGGWTLKFGLLPAQVRSFIQRMSSVDSEGVEGQLRLDLGAARFRGEVRSALPEALDEVHVVHGWHHQRLGRLEPGATASIDMPFVELFSGSGCGRHPGASCEHVAVCPSCGRYHSAAGAAHSALLDGTAERDLLQRQLSAEALRAPRFFRLPLLLGLRRPASPGGETLLVAFELPVAQLAAPATLPGQAAVREWTFHNYDYAGSDLLGSDTLGNPSRVKLNSQEPIRFLFPYRGEVSRITVDLGQYDGGSAGGSSLVSMFNVRRGAYEDFLRRKRDKVVVAARASEFFDPRDGSVQLKVSSNWGSLGKVDVTVEGAAR
ncbi:MAG: hypothetical protein HYY25_07025 [Candidatus Wallbacteria bacterium]|nr:hypothetical protein [Candidatus Wallbacteria bacterium]